MTRQKKVLVTGAANGIGAETANRLEKKGAQVARLDLEAEGEIIACDVRDQQSVDLAVAEAVERLGGLDVVINSAGVGLPQSAIKAPGPDAMAVLDINVLGTWRVNSAALPELRRSRGRILNIASGLAHLSMPLAPAYCASKRAVVGYSDSLRLEIGHEVEVTTVYPGYIKTRIHDASTSQGFGLEGIVPEERLEPACDAIVKAALGRYRRDVATTRSGVFSYAALRRLPRPAIDAGTRFSLSRQLGRVDFTTSPLAGDYAKAMRKPRK